MNKVKILGLLLGAIVLYSCGSDDDSDAIPDRDRNEVALEDAIELRSYLDTHFYNYEELSSAAPSEDVAIELSPTPLTTTGTIPLSEQVEERSLIRDGVNYTYYVLKVREGNGGLKPLFADSTLVSYQGKLLDNTVFDSSVNPIWFDIPGVIAGFGAALQEFEGATVITPEPDGTLSFQGSGVGAVFLPSGLGYFSRSINGIPAYSPLSFTFQLRSVNIADHDNDGILSIYEDLNGDRIVTTTGLDDSDNDRIFNFRDADDDNDGIPTIEENADPNGDGNPDDAIDTDGDGIPDYLDARTEQQ
ncbi:MAG: peptidylprolyl isomerase [Nonlabens sp.]